MIVHCKALFSIFIVLPLMLILIQSEIEGMFMKRQEIKDQTDFLIEELPEEVSWDDLMYRIYVRQKIERGIKDSETGKVRSTEQVRREFGLIT